MTKPDSKLCLTIEQDQEYPWIMDVDVRKNPIIPKTIVAMLQEEIDCQREFNEQACNPIQGYHALMCVSPGKFVDAWSNSWDVPYAERASRLTRPTGVAEAMISLRRIKPLHPLLYYVESELSQDPTQASANGLLQVYEKKDGLPQEGE